MPIEPVKIPQNVYIEDRVVGPLSLRQIIIIIIGGGFSYILFAWIQKTYGSVTLPITIMAWTPAGIAALFALVKVNDLSLARIVLLLVERASKSNVRTWVPHQGISINIRTTTKAMDDADAKKLAEQKQHEEEHTQTRIRELSSIIDRPIDSIEQRPVHHPAAPVVPTETAKDEDQKPLPLPPTRPAKTPNILPTTDGLTPPPATDLSVFRDIFPPENR